MNTLYVHIGTAKTGTTAIQKFCNDNQKVLEQKGYCYPIFSYRYENKSINRNAHFLIAEDYENRTGTFREAMDQIRHLFERYPNIILSDEIIWSRSFKQQKIMWQSLLKEASEGGFQVKIIVYFRRQDSYLNSGWNQNVKADGSSQTWMDYLTQKTNAFKMNYGSHLHKIASIVGKENIIVRRFEPKRFINGSLYDDFLHAVGLSLTDEYEIAQFMKNPKLAGNTHEIMRILNTMPGMDEKTNEFFRKALLSYADQSGEQYLCEMFSKEEAAAYMKKYEKQNQMIAQDYLDGEPLFDLTFKDLPKWEKNNPYMQDDLIRFVGACCMQMLSENQKRNEKISAKMLKEKKYVEQKIAKSVPTKPSSLKKQLKRTWRTVKRS